MKISSARLLIASLCITGASAQAQVSSVVPMPVPPQTPVTIATVNGKKIPGARYDAMLKQAMSQGQPDSPKLRADVTDAVITQELFSQEAEKKGFGNAPEVKASVERARQTIIIQAWIADYMKKNPVTDAEVKAEYDKYASGAREKEYLARHILVDSEETAKAIIAKLKAGEKFEDLAAQSKDGSAANGGLLDWSVASRYVKPFSDAMVALQKGQVTPTPVKSQFGYHVIRLEDVREQAFPAFETVKDRITEGLQEQKLQALQDSLKKKATIKR